MIEKNIQNEHQGVPQIKLFESPLNGKELYTYIIIYTWKTIFTSYMRIIMYNIETKCKLLTSRIKEYSSSIFFWATKKIPPYI